MKNIHVSDLDIQRFAFDQNGCEPKMVEHIRTCEKCQQRVDTYLSLADIIKGQPKVTPDYDLANLVLGKLAPSKKTWTIYNYLIGFIVFLVVGVAILTIGLYQDTISYLLDNAFINQAYCFASAIIFITIILGIDLFKSFNRKLKIVNA